MNVRRLATQASLLCFALALCIIALTFTSALAGAQKSSVCGGHDAVFIGTLDGTPYCSSWSSANSPSAVRHARFFSIGKNGRKTQLIHPAQRSLLEVLFRRHAEPDVIPAPRQARWTGRSLSFIDEDTGKKWLFQISEDGKSMSAECLGDDNPLPERPAGRLVRTSLAQAQNPTAP